MIAVASSSASTRYTGRKPLPSRKGQSLPHAVAGFDSSITSGAAAAPNSLERGFSFSILAADGARFPFSGGPCGDTRKCVPVPDAGLSTLHGLPPAIDSVGGGFKPSPSGAIMADIKLHFQSAPVRTRATFPKFKPTLIELHAEAENAMAMARYYLRRDNLPGARRKAVQALAALNQLRISSLPEAANDAKGA